MPRPQPIPLQSDWAYGPVPSRRFGRSLGVNLLPRDRKVCTYDCVYCQYDATPGAAKGDLPAPAEVLAAVEEALRRDPGCDAITLAGNGEPTLHPAFDEVVAGLAALRDALAPCAALVLLSNGARLDAPAVREALARIDLPFFKLDAGDPATLRAVDRPRVRAALPRLLAGLRRLGPGRFLLQAMFVQGAADNTTAPAVAGWLETVASLRPAGVHVTTVDRGTTLPGVLPAPRERLEALGRAVRARGVPAGVFPCEDEARFA
ncbi:MAG: radical SAM protein [Planctomycetes bacterium]|nr:radical SAM protein [Planctomycetota bacterium]